MCLKSPGARCYSHAKEDTDKIQANLEESQTTYEKALESSTSFDADYHRLAAKHGSAEATVKFYRKNAEQETRKAEKAKERLLSLAVKHAESIKETNATAGGIAKLEEEVERLQDLGHDAKIAKEDLQEARQTYNIRMEKYDAKNHTVFGRQPSPYGNDEGIDTLRAKLKKSEDSLAKLHRDELVNDTDNRVKIDRATESNRRLRGQLKHAYATDKRRQDGIIPKTPKVQASYSSGTPKHLNAENINSKVQAFLSDYPGAEIKIEKGFYRNQTEFKVKASVPGHRTIVGDKAVATFSMLDNESTPENVERYMKRYMRFYRV